ncbi:hypothetical protein C1646_675160 [Rhizophagus diaphanus]|nr:hypothetical protein C1646_675160 [Rhizophagus diaphanus] [Rhizophagus sp. MUCL 43196]
MYNLHLSLPLPPPPPRSPAAMKQNQSTAKEIKQTNLANYHDTLFKRVYGRLKASDTITYFTDSYHNFMNEHEVHYNNADDQARHDKLNKEYELFMKFFLNNASSNVHIRNQRANEEKGKVWLSTLDDTKEIELRPFKHDTASINTPIFTPDNQDRYK